MKYSNPKVASSYRIHDLGRVLYDIVLELKPKKIVEFGTLHGYSAIAMAMALHKLKDGHIISYDLWDKYEYYDKNHHGSKGQVQDDIDKYKLTEYITLADGDFKNCIAEPFDLLHVDINNDGKVIQDLAFKTRHKEGLVIFEGGSRERDLVPWMQKYNRPPMQSCGVKYEVIDERYPSLSKLI